MFRCRLVNYKSKITDINFIDLLRKGAIIFISFYFINQINSDIKRSN